MSDLDPLWVMPFAALLAGAMAILGFFVIEAIDNRPPKTPKAK